MYLFDSNRVLVNCSQKLANRYMLFPFITFLIYPLDIFFVFVPSNLKFSHKSPCHNGCRARPIFFVKAHLIVVKSRKET